MSRIHEALKKAEQERAAVQVTEADRHNAGSGGGGGSAGVFNDRAWLLTLFPTTGTLQSQLCLRDVGRIPAIRRFANAMRTSGVASRLQC